jgi:hypothetical protein
VNLQSTIILRFGESIPKRLRRSPPVADGVAVQGDLGGGFAHGCAIGNGDEDLLLDRR